jgi:nicotinamide phosphoribosyltransferase
MNPFLMTDMYKVGHPFQYPEKTQSVYSNFTPRKSRLPGVDNMVFFGLQYFIKKYLIEYFDEEFFYKGKNAVMDEYRRIIKNSLGMHLPTYEHIERIHDLGYLPIEIKALPEGSLVPMKVPALTIVNTLPEAYWLTNFIETWLSNTIWQPCTSATIAHEYRKVLNKYGKETGMPQEFIQWQGHDFSFRGMGSSDSGITSAMGHLLSFTGTDTIPTIVELERYYNANSDVELVGGSVNATEHSVMCSGGKGDEIGTFRRLITEVYPSGIVSIVSDTWDLWVVLTKYLRELKEVILARDGKVVIRPDSGDPVDIICGLSNEIVSMDAPISSTERHKQKGVVELLWDVFGGTINSQGYKVLDPHIGCIYGDSITLDRAKQICERLKQKGFATQAVLGLGSYTYQYNTRDTFGLAMKATHVTVNGEDRDIFKSPVTDDGTKKSATGLLRVDKVNGVYVLTDKVTKEEEQGGELKTIFKDGNLIKDYSLAEIRATLSSYL